MAQRRPAEPKMLVMVAPALVVGRTELAAIAAADHLSGGAGHRYRGAEFLACLCDECADVRGRGLVEALLLAVECKVRVVVQAGLFLSYSRGDGDETGGARDLKEGEIVLGAGAD